MVPYWLLYGIFFRQLVLRLRSLRATALTLGLLALPPWFQFLFPAVLEGEGYGEWYSSHRTGSLASWRSVLVVFLKFHPLCYVHVFLFGMCLARLRERYKAELASEHDEAQERASALAAPSPTMDSSRLRAAPRGGGCLSVAVGMFLNWGCLLGYAGLLLVFCTPAIKPFAYKLSVRLSRSGCPSSPSTSNPLPALLLTLAPARRVSRS